MLYGKRIHLRRWQEEDAPLVHAACQTEELQTWLNLPNPYTLAHAHQYIQMCQDKMDAKRSYHFAIVDFDEVVGSVGVLPLTEGVGSIGYWMHPHYHGKGYMHEAIGVIVPWAFNHMQLHRLELFCHPDNRASANVAVRAGFVYEGILRNHHVHRGLPTNSKMFSLTPADLTSTPI